jgi:hypothetical protein
MAPIPDQVGAYLVSLEHFYFTLFGKSMTIVVQGSFNQPNTGRMGERSLRNPCRSLFITSISKTLTFIAHYSLVQVISSCFPNPSVLLVSSLQLDQRILDYNSTLLISLREQSKDQENGMNQMNTP